MSIDKASDHKLTIRNLKISDYSEVKEIMKTVYSIAGGSWTKKELSSLIKRFPEGQICIEDNGKIVAAALSIIIKYSKLGDNHTYKQITANGTFSTHDEKGDTLYGIDVFVHPELQGMRLGRRLYDARKELCEQLNLRSIVSGGRIPGYVEYHKEMTPRQYIAKVRNKEIFDPILTFQLGNDFHIKKIITNYLPDDKESQSYATLLEWINTYYEEEENILSMQKNIARLGVVQ